MVNEFTAVEVFQRLERITGSSPGPKQVLESILHEAIELTGAERGFVLSLAEPATEVPAVLELATVVAVNLDSEGNEFAYSRTIVHDALRQSRGLVLLDAGDDAQFGVNDSVRRLELRSVMAVPLRIENRLVGAIYLDNRTQVGKFTEADLGLLTSFANVAALAVENARLLNYCRNQFHELVQTREAEKAAQKARKMAEQARRSTVDYVSGASQQLCQSLLALLAEVERHPGHPGAAPLTHLLGLCLGRAEELRDVARVECGQLEMRFAPVDLGALVNDLGRQFSPLARLEGGEIVADAAPDVSVVADESRLRQLLGTVVRYALEGGGPTAVKLSAGPGHPGTALVTLELNRELPSLPQPLLDFCQRVAALHHGRIWSDAREHSLTYALELPREQLSVHNFARESWLPEAP